MEGAVSLSIHVPVIKNLRCVGLASFAAVAMISQRAVTEVPNECDNAGCIARLISLSIISSTRKRLTDNYSLPTWQLRTVMLPLSQFRPATVEEVTAIIHPNTFVFLHSTHMACETAL